MPHMPSILSDFTAPTLVEAVEANMAEQFAYFRHTPRAEVQDTPEFLRYISGIPIPEYNGVIRARFAPGIAPDEIAARIADAIAPFATRRQPFFWWLGPTTQPADLGSHLAASGFKHAGNGPGMAADLYALREDAPTLPGLDIVHVEDERVLRHWVEIAGAGYGEPEAILEARYSVHLGLGLAEGLPLQRFLAYLDGQPVAMSALFLAAGVAGVYEVATIPAARRRGVGAAVMLAPLQHARVLGYRIGVLQASEMGVGVYSRLGFRQCCTFTVYAWEPSN